MHRVYFQTESIRNTLARILGESCDFSLLFSVCRLVDQGKTYKDTHEAYALMRASSGVQISGESTTNLDRLNLSLDHDKRSSIHSYTQTHLCVYFHYFQSVD